MDKNQILETAKLDMKQIIEELVLPRIPEAQEKLSSYLTFLEALEKLPVVILPAPAVAQPEPLVETKTEIAEPIKPIEEPKEEPKEEGVDVAHRFERKLKGGLLPSISAFVPEKIVRQLDLQHGDLVFAKKLNLEEQKIDGPTRYHFEVAERRGEPEPKDRVQINWAIVQYDESLDRFVCEKTMSGEYIRLDEMIHTILLSPEDVSELKIKDGDSVDLAYSTKQTGYVRAIWRYSIDHPSDFVETSAKSAIKKKTDKVKRDYPQTLTDKTVLMVGFEPGRPAFEEEVERRGGKLEWSSGKEGHDRMFTMVNKSDCVINIIQQMGHRGSMNAVEIAKTLNVPHDNLHTLGRSSFIQKVYNCLGIISPE